MSPPSPLADFLRARPPLPNGGRVDAWGVPTPRAVGAGYALRREASAAVAASVLRGGRQPDLDEAWERLAAEGLIPPSWLGEGGRVFAVQSGHRTFRRPWLAEQMITFSSRVNDAEDVEEAARAVAACLPPWPVAAAGDGVAWMSGARGEGADGIVAPLCVVAACEAASARLTPAERDEARRRAYAGILSDGLDASGAGDPPSGGRLVNRVFTLAHQWGVLAERGGSAPNPCVALLSIWERGVGFYGVQEFLCPDDFSRRAPRLALAMPETWPPRW